MHEPTAAQWNELKRALQGEVHRDHLHRHLYATDASVYRQIPIAVVYPRHTADLCAIMRWCTSHGIPVIPRAGGSSLAGQCVGAGVVIDCSRYMNAIVSLPDQREPGDLKPALVTVQPGVIRDDLNRALAPLGHFYGPNTSTSNRATIGGMIGNNSCGSTSIVYGAARDHIASLEIVLSSGETATLAACSRNRAEEYSAQDTQLGHIYREMIAILNDDDLYSAIQRDYPDAEVSRRNTGYALDVLAHRWRSDAVLDLPRIIAGSEGTLCLISRCTIQASPLPPAETAVIAAHFHSVYESLLGVESVMALQPNACELMDKIILDLTRDVARWQEQRKILVDDPEGVLLIEIRAHTLTELDAKIATACAALSDSTAAYALPVAHGTAASGLWELRKAGLGILANLPGDEKAVACVEDTAVTTRDLPEYIKDFSRVMSEHGQRSVYYAHAGAGEIHLRPVLNLKTSAGVRDFLSISAASAALVKKYRGSLSGEHGDGRVRAPHLVTMYSQETMTALWRIKKVWDPQRAEPYSALLNPHKILDPLPQDSDLRYEIDRKEPEYDAFMDYSAIGGLHRLAENCNGSADCRKSPESGGVMCPSYHATRREKDTTRARANIIREHLTQDHLNLSDDPVMEALDLCLGCKACKSECPSQVDVGMMKAEALYQRHQKHGLSWKDRLISRQYQLSASARSIPALYNLVVTKLAAPLVRGLTHVHPSRRLPKLSAISARRWYTKHYQRPDEEKGQVYLFLDEFTTIYESHIAITCIQLLRALGYHVMIADHTESGRAAISRGMLDHARDCADRNVSTFKNQLSEDIPLVGIEPSAILSFRDEYPRVVSEHLRESAHRISPYCLTIDEFLHREMSSGKISMTVWDSTPRSIILHGHCHQKALSDISLTAGILSIPPGHQVELIQAGCCGMAGAFGYEREHYEVSMQIAELQLMPAIRARKSETIVCATGTSCREQIHHCEQMEARHPVEILYAALADQPRR